MAIFRLYPNLPQSADGEVSAALPRRRAVYRRLKASYGPTYLTILSVIQAVAMGDLAQVVAGGYQRFTTVQWVLTLNTFGVLIIIWNAYSVQSTLWGWIPDVRDSAAPFVVGALELYLNHTIIVSLSACLVAVSLVGVAGAAGRCISTGAQVVSRSSSSSCARSSSTSVCMSPICSLAERRCSPWRGCARTIT